MHGFISAGELIRQPLHLFHTNEQMKQEVYPFLEMVELIGQYTRRLGHRRTDQSEFTAETTAFLMQDEEDAVIGYVLYAADIETRQRDDKKDLLTNTMEHCT
jgi:hypothetical protein